MNIEIWEWIPGFENQYKVSSFGRVKSYKRISEGQLMSGTKSKDGRVRVNLNGRKYLVHRLVLLTFKPEEQKSGDNIVMHIDGDQTNNYLDNLKWGTFKENAKDQLAIQRNLNSQRQSKEARIKEQSRIISDERWKDIPGYEGKYQISDYGRVKSLHKKTPHIMSLIKQTTSDYYVVGLSKNGKKKHYSVNRLVAEAFVDNPLNLSEVNHINENTLDNYYKNLEWCDHAKNVQHSIYRQSIQVEQYDLNGKLLQTYPSIAEASRVTGVNRQSLGKAVDGRFKTAGGYIWKALNKEL